MMMMILNINDKNNNLSMQNSLLWHWNAGQ